jgi:hypothetical protein
VQPCSLAGRIVRRPSLGTTRSSSRAASEPERPSLLTLREVETAGLRRHERGQSLCAQGRAGRSRGPLGAASEDDECWTLVNPALRPVRVRYEYDLAGAADSFDNADYVQRHGEALTFSDEAVLLRPDPLPKLQPSPLIEIEFSVPREVQVTAPWLRLPGPGIRYRFDAAQYDGGSYVTVGKFRSLGLLALKNSRVELYVVGTAKASDETLRTWIEKAAAMSDGFYGQLMPPVVHIVLVPIAGRSSLGIFGTVLRPLRPSVVIYFGGDATELPLHDDWVAPHEIFHIGNPRVRYKIPWLVEGFTTYYQDVLRARAGALTAEEAWSDLWDGVRKYCQPAGTSLQSESARLRQTYHYTRVYWGGACLALLLDVEIRTRSRGQRSLDDVMRELRAQSLGRTARRSCGHCRAVPGDLASAGSALPAGNEVAAGARDAARARGRSGWSGSGAPARRCAQECQSAKRHVLAAAATHEATSD